MYSRREFIIGTGGLITMSVLDRYITYIENHGEPLVEAPKTALSDYISLSQDLKFRSVGGC